MVKRFFLAAVMIISSLMVARAQAGTWSGKLDVQGTKLSIVFHLDGDSPTMDSPDQGVKGIPIQIEKSGTNKITIKIPSLGASFEGVWIIKNITGAFKQSGLSLPLTLTPGDGRPNRPQTPKGPFPYTTEEVSFSNSGIVLNGTLTLPENYSRNTPVLIMVTGSGQQNRDEELFEHRPFAVIADALARAGIATLRYDDRGFGQQDASILNSTTEDFKNDALAGINFLRERFDNVGVIGHSEGGTIALMLAAEQKADFIVSLAGMAISGAETMVMQNRLALAEAGVLVKDIETYCKMIAEAFNVRVNGGKMPSADDYDLPEALKQNYLAVLAQLQMPYMTHFLALDMRPLLHRITCPVLALNGTKDVQVDMASNLDALRTGLRENKKNLIMPVEGVNHLFQHCTTGAVSEYRNIEETIAPEVLQTISDWVSELF